MAKQQIIFRSQQSITYLPEGYIHLTLGSSRNVFQHSWNSIGRGIAFGEGPEWIVVP